MSFRFSLGRAQIKHFKTALNTLNKIGGELLVEAVPEQLVLRSINTAKSAFLSVTYFSRFFDSYEIYDTTVVQTVVLAKNALAIFRSQKISQIEFKLDNEAAKLYATVHTDEGLIKRYAFNCLDGEVLQATVDREAYPTVVIAEASELEKLLSSFQHTLDEITLIANPLSAAALANGHKACEMRSFVDPLKAGQESALLTSLTLDTRSVFTSYSHSSPLAADVTFNVKDFRAMTALCTALGADVALRLEAAGAPLVVEPHFRGLRDGSETDFQAMLVLSTLTDSQLGPEHLAQQEGLEEGQQQQQQQQQRQPVQQPQQPAPPQPQRPQQRQHHPSGLDQEQPGPPAAAAADPPSPYVATGGGGGLGAYGGGAPEVSVGGGGAPLTCGADGGTTGRGRRRLPQRPDAGAAHGAYAAAAAAEGLPMAAGGAAGTAAGPGLLPGAAAPGPGGWPGAAAATAAEGSTDGGDYDIPARRIGRPPRYDPVSPAFAAQYAAAAGAGAGACAVGPTPDVGVGGGGAGAAAAGDASFLHPTGLPNDPRVGPAARPGAGAGAGTDQQYLRFPRGTGPGAAADATVEAGAPAEDSQDPEILPGMRSPYGRHGQAPAVGAFGSHGSADPRVAIGGAPGIPAGPAASSWAAGHVGQHAQQYAQQQAGPGREPHPVVDHADLFGEEDDEAGYGGGAVEYDDDDDDEVPATPPEQQQTRSMGAGVLGLGGAPAADQAG